MSATVQNAYTEVTPKTPITITPAAALKSFELIQEEDNMDLKLRVSILGGGCHGFRYQFSFADTIEPDDTVIPQLVSNQKDSNQPATVSWVIGLMSLQLLNGVEIDYESDLGGERFIIRHLKVKTTCSCGHSFAAPDPEDS